LFSLLDHARELLADWAVRPHHRLRDRQSATGNSRKAQRFGYVTGRDA
jgi:hypothetical protein